MSKTKERSELEALRAQNRKLKAAMKALTKTASRATKEKIKYEGLELEMNELLQEENNADHLVIDNSICPDCFKGKLEKIDLKVRKMFVCNNCSYRRIIK